MHPILVAALAGAGHQRCPCSAATKQPYRLCCNCRHGQHLDVHDDAAAPSPRCPPSAHHLLKASLFARVVSPLQSASKGTES
jgi:hypothetical protein